MTPFEEIISDYFLPHSQDYAPPEEMNFDDFILYSPEPEPTGGHAILDVEFLDDEPGPTVADRASSYRSDDTATNAVDSPDRQPQEAAGGMEESVAQSRSACDLATSQILPASRTTDNGSMPTSHNLCALTSAHYEPDEHLELAGSIADDGHGIEAPDSKQTEVNAGSSSLDQYEDLRSSLRSTDSAVVESNHSGSRAPPDVDAANYPAFCLSKQVSGLEGAKVRHMRTHDQGITALRSKLDKMLNLVMSIMENPTVTDVEIVKLLRAKGFIEAPECMHGSRCDGKEIRAIQGSADDVKFVENGPEGAIQDPSKRVLSVSKKRRGSTAHSSFRTGEARRSPRKLGFGLLRNEGTPYIDKKKYHPSARASRSMRKVL